MCVSFGAAFRRASLPGLRDAWMDEIWIADKGWLNGVVAGQCENREEPAIGSNQRMRRHVSIVVVENQIRDRIELNEIW